MIIAELSMFPIDKGESLSTHVARILDIIDQSGIAYRLNPMGTVMEGEWDEVMTVVKQSHQALEHDCARISTTLKIDFRKGDEPRMATKMSAVEKKAGKELRK